MSSQASKKSREHRKQAKHAGFPENFAHPSHVAGMKRYVRHLKEDLCDSCAYRWMNPFDQYFCDKRPKELIAPRYKCKDYKRKK